MDVNKDLPNCIPFPVHINKLKRPIVSLLNEYIVEEDFDYDVFETYKTGICPIVTIPENLAELHSGLEDMLHVIRLVSLRYDIGRDALRIAIHLFYRIVLLEKNYYFHDFILYYEQYNKSWSVLSEEYHSNYKELQDSPYIEEDDSHRNQMRSKSETNNHTEEATTFKKLSKSVKRIVLGTDRSFFGAYASDKNNFDENTSSMISSLKLENGKKLDVYPDKQKVLAQLKNVNHKINKKCFYIDRTECSKECSHSQFVRYQLYRTGDFLMATGDDGDEYRQCHCYRMKTSVVRDIHPCFRDLAWGTKHLCLYRYWCFVNCYIRSKSLEMLKSIHPNIEILEEGFLAPCIMNNPKRLTLKTTALKCLVFNYSSI